MKMFRTIHPVGQGAFYTEKFYCDSGKTITVVYDCGSESSFSGRGSLIDNEISQTFNKGDEITAVFISHLHNDHINGVKKLLKYCKVKYVFMPVLTEESKLLIEVYENGNDAAALADDPKGFIGGISPDTSVILVDEANIEDFNRQNAENGFTLDGEKQTIDDSIPSGTNLIFSDQEIEWKYTPFNLRHDDLYQKIASCLSDDDLDPKNYTLSKFMKIKAKIDNVIKSAKDKNINSMALYSGSFGSTKWCLHKIHSGNNYLLLCPYNICRLCDLCASCREYEQRRTGCLYLGDFDLNQEKAFEKLLKKLDASGAAADNILLVQVPHHGSMHNFNDRICREFVRHKIFFVSFGEKNKYRHPSCTVIEKILNSDNAVIRVTENKLTAACFIYSDE